LPHEAVLSTADSTYTAASIEDLDALRRRQPRGRVIVQLALPDLDAGDRADIERRISRSLIACGCNEGAVLGLLYLVLVPLLVLTGALAPSLWLGWAAVVTGFIMAMFVGKVLGLAFARVRLWRALAEAARAFDTTSA